MPRKRMINPNFWRDEKIGQCTHMERLLFQGLWTFAEDNGVGRANPLLIKADVFPYDTLREADITKALNKLASLGLIILYEVDGQKYYKVTNFTKHQKINRPSACTLPEPPEVALTEPSLSTHGALTLEENIREENIREDKLSKEKENIPAREKKQFGEFGNVKLTDEEYDTLCSRFSKEETNKAIEELSVYMQSKGKAYKDHYATLINWCKRNLEKSGKKPTTNAAPTKEEYERMQRYLAKMKGDDDG